MVLNFRNRIELAFDGFFCKQKMGIYINHEPFWSERKFTMEEQFKNNLKKMAEEAEMRVARTVLRWKYKKEGKNVPQDNQLECESRHVADRVNEVVAKRGKAVFSELKKAYVKKKQE